MSLQKQLEYKKGFFMYKVFNNEAPDFISNMYTHPPSRYSNSRNYQLRLPRPRIGIWKQVNFSLVLFNGATYLCRPCQSVNQSILYFMSVYIEVILDKQTNKILFILISHWTMNNRLDNISDNISIIQYISYIVVSI